ncbi:MAG TPA: two-component regulator propeller domain-containing protein [Chitinophagaceae bacterium]|nr:two-component regulator propeller domain-containing protein [Chitinophagaceae bacterium]
MNRSRFIYILFLLLLAKQSAATPPSIYFTKLTNIHGLSHDKVNCILEDKRGFIWFGTDDGLNRYDGNKFVVFRNQPANPSSISGNIVTNLLEDKNGVIWIATADGGLTKYDYRLSPDKQFKQYKHSLSDSSSIPVNIINALIEDRQGYLWLGTSGHGVLRFDKKTETFRTVNNARARTALALCLDDKGIIWVGREGGGLLKIDPATLHAEADERYTNVYLKLPHMVVTSLFKDSRNHIWFGSWDKVVYRYNSQSKQEEVFQHDGSRFSFGKDDPISFAEDHRRRIWIGGKYGGLYVYDPIANQFYHYRHDPARDGTLVDNQVNCIYMDRTGIIWLGTNRGVSVHNPMQQQFEQTFLPPAKDGAPITIYDFFEAGSKGLLVGTSNGIYRQQPDGGFQHIPLTFQGQPLAVTKFFRAKDNTLYLGTNVSLFTFNPVTYQIQQLPNTSKDIVMNRIIESRVASMTEHDIEGHPTLLVAPYGHFFAYYDFASKHWVSRQDTVRQIIQRYKLRDHLVRKFYKSTNGTVWLANTKAGLGEWVNDPYPTIKYYSNIPNKSESISNNHVYDITEDKHGNLWVSTYGGGLHYFIVSTKRFLHIESSYNLGEGIQTDDNGNVWMIANGDLHKYEVGKRIYSTFPLPDIEKTGGVKGYIYKASDGRMFIAGANYFIAFHPDSIREMNTQPTVYLTDFKVFNTSFSHLLFGRKIELRHNQNFFSFEFAAPDFQGPERPVQYSWKLEGVDPGWTEAGTSNTANYTNLSGGDYVFKVRATSRPGIWSNEIATISIRIIPPFWKRPWFFIVCGLLILGTIYLIYRYRINELLKRQAIRNKIAQDLHDNVGSTLSSISVYSQVAKIHNEQGNRDDLQGVLVRIAATSSEMISEMNDIVWTINPRNDNMQKILQRMESFAKPLLHTQNIQFRFKYDPAVMHLNLEMEKRKNFYLIFKEAVNNTLKYSGCKKMEVTVSYHHHHIQLKVQDDGVGFDNKTIETKNSQSLSGNGLNNMARRAREMGGTCIIQSEPGKGTLVSLRFPVP